MKHKKKKIEPEAPTSLVSSLLSLASMATKITKKNITRIGSSKPSSTSNHLHRVCFPKSYKSFPDNWFNMLPASSNFSTVKSLLRDRKTQLIPCSVHVSVLLFQFASSTSGNPATKIVREYI